MAVTKLNQVATPYTRIATVASSGTWDHPDGYSSARPIRVICIAGGGGGGSGSIRVTTAANAQNSGGGGGSGSIYIQDTFISSQATITIGAGGTGGAGVTQTGVGNKTGNSGTDGGDTIFSATGVYLRTLNEDLIDGWGTMGGSGGLGSGSHGASAGHWGNSTSVSTKSGKFGSSPERNAYSTLYPGTGFQIPNAFAPYLSGGGAKGGPCSTSAGLAASPAGVGFMGNNGGAGSIGVFSSTANGTATSSVGSAAVGYGGGGGGSGAAVVFNATVTSAVATSGAGGNGAPGVVYIYY